jgi:hypothetical protein
VANLKRTLTIVVLLASVGAPSAANARQIHRWCVIPNVRGTKLRAAEERVRDASCSVGRVTGPRSAFVSAESPEAGRHEQHGTKVALTLGTNDVQSTQAKPTGIPGSWHLVLDSNFTGTRLPPDWRTDWFGKTAAIAHTEIDCYSPNNVTFPGDGALNLLVTAQPSTCAGTVEPYTAAVISTNPDDGRSTPGFQYTYGVLEARIYVPGDNGKLADWPAFWATGQSWPITGEDDVLEGLGGSACWSFHNAQGLRNGCLRTLGPGWHTFASDWEPGSLTYYYDGIEVKKLTTGITSSPMYVILNNGVHSNLADVTEPDAMKVQYVRVWQR